jgi:hypothetical protein
MILNDGFYQLFKEFNRCCFLDYGFIGAYSGFSGLSRIITQDIYRNTELALIVDHQSARIRFNLGKTSINNNIKKESMSISNKPDAEEDLYSGDLFDVSKGRL